MELLTSQQSSQLNDIFILVGQTLSQVSDRMVQLGLIWFITSTFGENLLIWYLVVGGLPHLLLVKHSGNSIQKYSSLKVVLGSDLARGFVYLVGFSFVVAFPNWLSAPKESPILALLFGSVFLSNIFSAFFNPAIMSLSVEIKKEDEVQKLTAKLSSITSFATILGPIIGLSIFNAFNLSGLFLTAGFSYFISAYAVALVSKVHKKMKSDGTTHASLSDSNIPGAQKIIAVMLFVFMCINLTLSPIQVLMPALAKDLFGNSFNSLAILETFLGFGILLGGIVLSVFSIERKMLFWTWIFLLAMSLAYVGFNLSPFISSKAFVWHELTIKLNFLNAAISVFFVGFTLGMANILILNILQTQPTAAEVPKVMSYVNLISTATLPFSLAFLGVFQNMFLITTIGFVSSMVLVFIVLFSFIPFRLFGREIFK